MEGVCTLRQVEIKTEKDPEDNEDLSCKQFEADCGMDVGDSTQDSFVCKKEREVAEIESQFQGVETDSLIEFVDIKPGAIKEEKDDSENPTCEQIEASCGIDVGDSIQDGIVRMKEREVAEAYSASQNEENDFQIEFVDVKPDIDHEFESYKDKQAMEESERLVSSGNEMRCDQCDFTSHEKTLFRRHMKNRHSVKYTYQCFTCDYTCRHKGILKRHIMVKHTGERPYLCPDCDYACARIDHLKRHIHTKHTLEMLLRCPHCDYACAQQGHLNRHVQTKHTLARPHQCPHCDYACVRGDHLKTHITAKHSSERRHQCPHCDYVCVRGDHLKTHITAKHSSERRLQCLHCDYVCVRGDHLKRHVQSKHSLERPHQCSHCNYASACSTSLKRHIQRRHRGLTPAAPST